jgi:hypothetical protein
VLLTAELRAGPGRFVKIGGVESDSLINGLRSTRTALAKTGRAPNRSVRRDRVTESNCHPFWKIAHRRVFYDFDAPVQLL